MAEYVLVYKDGGQMPEGEAAQKAVMEAWTKWFDDLGDKIVNRGAPFGATKSIASDGGVGDGSVGLTGFSIIEADSLDAAVEIAKGCPVLGGGSSIEVCETFDVM